MNYEATNGLYGVRAEWNRHLSVPTSIVMQVTTLIISVVWIELLLDALINQQSV